jgi:hypothetical protein
MVYEGLNPGDETRRNGDYVGLPHDEAGDGLEEGQFVAHDGTDIESVGDDGTSDFTEGVVGVLYTYQYAGDSGGAPQPDSNIDQSRDATVKTSGTVVAEFDYQGFTPSAGDVLGPNGEVVVLQAADCGVNAYEVLLR